MATPFTETFQAGSEDQHISVSTILDYVPGYWAYGWNNYAYMYPVRSDGGRGIDWIQALTIPAVWFATVILLILGPWESFSLMLSTGDVIQWITSDSLLQA